MEIQCKLLHHQKSLAKFETLMKDWEILMMWIQCYLMCYALIPGVLTSFVDVVQKWNCRTLGTPCIDLTLMRLPSLACSSHFVVYGIFIRSLGEEVTLLVVYNLEMDGHCQEAKISKESTTYVRIRIMSSRNSRAGEKKEEIWKEISRVLNTSQVKLIKANVMSSLAFQR